MGSNRKARDDDFANVPTAVHAKRRAAARLRGSEADRDAMFDEELTPVTPVAMVSARAPSSSASATLDEMVQLLRHGLTTDAPKALRTTDLVVRAGGPPTLSGVSPARTEYDDGDDPELTATYASRFADLPPGPDIENGTHARCAFDSEPPTVCVPDIPRAPRLPALEGMRMMAPTVSSYPPGADVAMFSVRSLAKPLRIAGLLILTAAAFLVAALLTLYW